MLFAGFKKEEINTKGTNNLNWLKAKQLLNKELINKSITQYVVRGPKPEAKISPYAKWQRILKTLEKYDQSVVYAYNPFMGYILRFLQLTGKARIADRDARKANAKAEKEAREERIKEAEIKNAEKEEKLQVAKVEAEEKEEPFDIDAWVKNFHEESPPVEVGDEIVE